MTDVIEYPLEAGGTVLVAVAGLPQGVVTRGWGRDRVQDTADRATETFEAAVARVRPAADALLSSLTELQATPNEISVEFAVQLTAGAGVCIATLGSQANFRITLTWRPTAQSAG